MYGREQKSRGFQLVSILFGGVYSRNHRILMGSSSGCVCVHYHKSMRFRGNNETLHDTTFTLHLKAITSCNSRPFRQVWDRSHRAKQNRTWSSQQTNTSWFKTKISKCGIPRITLYRRQSTQAKDPHWLWKPCQVSPYQWTQQKATKVSKRIKEKKKHVYKALTPMFPFCPVWIDFLFYLMNWDKLTK